MFFIKWTWLNPSKLISFVSPCELWPGRGTRTWSDWPPRGCSTPGRLPSRAWLLVSALLNNSGILSVSSSYKCHILLHSTSSSQQGLASSSRAPEHWWNSISFQLLYVYIISSSTPGHFPHLAWLLVASLLNIGGFLSVSSSCKYPILLHPMSYSKHDLASRSCPPVHWWFSISFQQYSFGHILFQSTSSSKQSLKHLLYRRDTLGIYPRDTLGVKHLP